MNRTTLLTQILCAIASCAVTTLGCIEEAEDASEHQPPTGSADHDASVGAEMMPDAISVQSDAFAGPNDVGPEEPDGAVMLEGCPSPETDNLCHPEALMACGHHNDFCYTPEADETCIFLDDSPGAEPDPAASSELYDRFSLMLPTSCDVIEGGGACLDTEGERLCCYSTDTRPVNGECGRPFFVAHHARRASAALRSDWV